MFVIHGIFNSAPTERLISNLTEFSYMGKFRFAHQKAYCGEIFDFSKKYGLFDKNVSILNSFPKKGVILPPSIKIAEFYEKFSDFLIIRFPVSEPLKPALQMSDFQKVLTKFEPLKHKTLIELSGECIDFNMHTTAFDILSYNQAILKCAIKGAKTFFDECSFSSYYTYLDDNNNPHLVFMEDTKSISRKHNLVKDSGFLGICWKDVSKVADGNWESLKGAYQNL
jgi:hypothetical protein